MSKVKMTSTGVHIIEGLFLKINGHEYRLKDFVYSSFENVDKNRLVAIVRQYDFQYGETSLGYVHEFIPDQEGTVVGNVRLGTLNKSDGMDHIIHTSEIIGWCYLDE